MVRFQKHNKIHYEIVICFSFASSSSDGIYTVLFFPGIRKHF